MGNDDFFFCHWEAEEETDIHEALDYKCLSEKLLTACYRIHEHIQITNLTGRLRKYPPWKED